MQAYRSAAPRTHTQPRGAKPKARKHAPPLRQAETLVHVSETSTEMQGFDCTVPSTSHPIKDISQTPLTSAQHGHQRADPHPVITSHRHREHSLGTSHSPNTAVITMISINHSDHSSTWGLLGWAPTPSRPTELSLKLHGASSAVGSVCPGQSSNTLNACSSTFVNLVSAGSGVSHPTLGTVRLQPSSFLPREGHTHERLCSAHLSSSETRGMAESSSPRAKWELSS